MSIPLRVIWRLSFGRNKDSDLISPKCPWESLPRGNNHLVDLAVQCGSFHLRGESKNEGSLSLCGHSSLNAHICIFEDESRHNKILSLYTHVTSSKQRVSFSMFVLPSFYEGVWVWAVVGCENSQGEEPFISQGSAITEACSHRHNHLLELLEIGSPKWYGLGVHHSIQGNFCMCHSNKNHFSVLAESLRDKRFALWCPLGIASGIYCIFFVVAVM